MQQQACGHPTPPGSSPWPRHAMLEALAGHWRLERHISGLACMQGQAWFRWQAPGQLQYAEHGQVTLANGSRHQARQHYLFEGLAQGFSVWFAQTPPRLFHRIQLSPALEGEAIHGCGADRYHSHYRFQPDDSFVVTHTVQGPRKDYVSTTVFRRCQPCG